jgi:hypothetical protein
MEICKKEITCFDDLVFGIHPSAGRGSVASMHELPNGIIISIIGGFPREGYTNMGGDGIHHFEIGAWHKEGHDWIPLGVDNPDGILYWQNRNQVTEVIQKLLKM